MKVVLKAITISITKHKSVKLSKIVNGIVSKIGGSNEIWKGIEKQL
jgi:hypothetical protein